MATKYQVNFPPCPLCGKPKEKRAKTCAYCAGKGRGAVIRRHYVEKTCLYCQSIFEIPLWRARQKRGTFCSKECKDKHLATLTGSKSIRWQGGYDRRRGQGWKAVREWALIRAQGKCEQCGAELSYHNYGVHHKKRYKLCKDDTEANLMSNLIVLCRSCHSRLDRLGCLPKRGGDGRWVKNSG